MFKGLIIVKAQGLRQQCHVLFQDRKIIGQQQIGPLVTFKTFNFCRGSRSEEVAHYPL